jgi:hypothetical protein
MINNGNCCKRNWNDIRIRTTAQIRYQLVIRKLRNEKQWQRSQLVRESLEQYKNKQPIIDNKQQLSRKIVDKVIRALQRTKYMTPQHITLINNILTMPGTTIKAEYQRQIAAINALVAFCDIENPPRRQPILSQNALQPTLLQILLQRGRSAPKRTRTQSFSTRRSRQSR